MKRIQLFILAVVILFTACGVYAEEPPLFSTFGEAVSAAMETVDEGDIPYCISGEGYCVALIRQTASGRMWMNRLLKMMI